MTIKQPRFAFLCDDFGVESLFDFCKKEVNFLKKSKIIIQPEYYSLFKNIKGLNLEHFPLSKSKGWALVLGMLSFKELDGVVIITDPNDFVKMNCHVQNIIATCKEMEVFCAIDGFGAYGAIKIISNYQELQALEEQRVEAQKRELLEQESKKKKEQYLKENPIYWFDEQEPSEANFKEDNPLPKVSKENLPPSQESRIKKNDSVEASEGILNQSPLNTDCQRERAKMSVFAPPVSFENLDEWDGLPSNLKDSASANKFESIKSRIGKDVNNFNEEQGSESNEKKQVLKSENVELKTRTIMEIKGNIKARTQATKKRAFKGSQIRKSKK